MEQFDVVIVGGGPAGIFTAYELIQKNKSLKVAIFEKVKGPKNRKCPKHFNGGHCTMCPVCSITYG